MVSVEIPAEFGYVIFVFLSTFILMAWLGINVGRARKRYEISYPAMYATGRSQNDNMFNCIQRAHQNTLEGYPFFLVCLFLSGLYCPTTTAVLGMLWVVGKVLYAQGYYTGDPEKRRWGAVSYLGLLPMIVMTGMFAAKLLGFIN